MPSEGRCARGRMGRGRKEYCKLLLPLVSCPERWVVCLLPRRTRYCATYLRTYPRQKSSSSFSFFFFFFSFSSSSFAATSSSAPLQLLLVVFVFFFIFFFVVFFRLEFSPLVRRSSPAVYDQCERADLVSSWPRSFRYASAEEKKKYTRRKKRAAADGRLRASGTLLRGSSETPAGSRSASASAHVHIRTQALVCDRYHCERSVR